MFDRRLRSFIAKEHEGTGILGGGAGAASMFGCGSF